MKEETKKKKKKKFASSFEGRIFLSTDNFTLRNEHTRGSSNACFDEGKTECLKKRDFGSRKLAEISKSGTNTLTTRSLYAVYTHTHTHTGTPLQSVSTVFGLVSRQWRREMGKNSKPSKGSRDFANRRSGSEW